MPVRPFSFVLAALFCLAATPEASAQWGGKPSELTDAEADHLLAQSEQILFQIEQLRGIGATREMARAVMDREGLTEALQALVDRELPPAAREAQNRLTYAFGLTEERDAWIAQYLGLLQTEVAGFYDHETETFYILADTPPEAQASVMAHELFHGVQDQRWGIETIIGQGEFLSDVVLSAQSLIEGDAVAVMMAYSLGAEAVTHGSVARSVMSGAMQRATSLNTTTAPQVMWDQLVFPYASGLAFVFSLVAPDDWSAVNAAYVDPPRSTEQVMHPERYVERDMPTWLEFSVDGVPGAERYLADVFGEMMIGSVLRALLADRVSAESCARAAEGWDGDRLEAFRFADDPERDLLVWLSVWDSEDDARGFAVTASRLSTPWLNTMERTELSGAHGGSWTAETPDGLLYVERWGDLALVVSDRFGTVGEAERHAAVSQAVASVWRTASRHAYPTF